MESKELALKLVEEAQSKNATIVTASPHCYDHLKNYCEVKDIVHLIEEHIE